MSRVMAIEEIGLDDEGYLLVRPSFASADEFTHIYCAATGIRWNSQLRTLQAYEPARWTATDLYEQVIAAVLNEYGIQLQATTGTVWSRILAEVRKAIETSALGTPAD